MRDNPLDIFNRIEYPTYRYRRREREEEPLPLVGLDSETYTTGEPFMFCTPERVIRPEEVPEVFFRDFPGVCFVVYNIDFDAGSLLYHLPAEQLDLLRVLGEVRHKGVSYRIIEHKELTLSKDGIKVVVWDIFQYFGTSLNEAARKYLGGEEKVDIETKRFTPRYVQDHWEEIARYCQKDAELTQRLAELVRDTFSRMEVPAAKLISTAYLSEQHFSRRSRPYVLGRDFQNLRPAVELAFRAYSGGVFACWKRGKGHFWLYDINSAYPEAIASLVDLRGASWVREAKYYPHATYAWYLCRARLDPDQDLYHPLAVRQDGINFYPAGEFEKAMTKPELEYLYRHGVEVEILDAWHCYARREDARPFRQEVLRLYAWKEDLKRRGEKGMEYQAVKILLNSLYGKFMQLTPVLPVSLILDALEAGTLTPEEVLDDRRRAGWLSYRAGRLWNPFYATYITALVRLKVLGVAERNKDAAVAVATDSILTTRPLDLPLGEDLGTWSLEAEGDGLVIGSGVYQIGAIKKFRGFTAKTDFLAYAGDLQAREIVILEERPFSWKEVLHRGLPKDYINRFHAEERRLDINFEIRRVWEREWASVEDMLTSGLMSSTPRLYLELPEEERGRRQEQRVYRRLAEQERRAFRRLILGMGGVRPGGDYEALPRWCRRRKGRALDDMVGEVAELGYPVTCADELWALLWQY